MPCAGDKSPIQTTLSIEYKGVKDSKKYTLVKFTRNTPTTRMTKARQLYYVVGSNLGRFSNDTRKTLAEAGGLAEADTLKAGLKAPTVVTLYHVLCGLS